MVFPEDKDLKLLCFKNAGIQSAQASHVCCLNDYHCLYSFFNKTKKKGEYLRIIIFSFRKFNIYSF